MNSINHFLELIAKEVKNRLGILCSDRMTLDDQLASARGSAYYMQVGTSCHLHQILCLSKSIYAVVIFCCLFFFNRVILIKARRQLVMYLNSW